MYVMKTELKKAVRTKYFLAAVSIGTAITILSLVYNVGRLETRKIYEGINPCYEGFTLFNSWIGGEPFSLGSSLYFFVFPLLIAIPYGWSFCGERTSGYMRQVIVRTGMKRYLTAKYIATFLSGGLAMILPLVINLLITAMFFPANKPIPSYDTMYGVFGVSMFSELYYTHPFGYVGLYLLVDFIFCGALTCLTMISAWFVKYKWINCIFPFVVCMAINMVSRFMYTNEVGRQNYQISPFYFTRCSQTAYPASFSIIMGMTAVLFFVTVAFHIIVTRNKKNEVL